VLGALGALGAGGAGGARRAKSLEKRFPTLSRHRDELRVGRLLKIGVTLLVPEWLING